MGGFPRHAQQRSMALQAAHGGDRGLGVERLTIAEAAQRLGVSEVTIRRRVRSGQLASEKEETAAGFMYRVLLPSPEELGHAEEQRTHEHQVHAESAALEAALETLRQELERRSEENRRLQELLAREQALVQSLISRMPALPEGEPIQEPTQESRPSTVPEQPSQGWWQRLRSRIVGE